MRFERAKRRREHCQRPHGRLVHHLGDGRWWDEDAGAWRNGKGRLLARPAGFSVDVPGLGATRVFLAAAHLNQSLKQQFS